MSHNHLVESMRSQSRKLKNPDNQAQLDKLISYAERAVQVDGKIYSFPKDKKTGLYSQTLTRDYWRTLEIPKAAIDTLLDEEGRWKYKVSFESYMQAMKGRPRDFAEFLHDEVYQALYVPVQPVLNDSGVYKGVFNDHTLDRHIAQLLEISNHIKFPEMSQFMINALAATINGHDSGPFHRTSHSYMAEVVHYLMLGEKIFEDETFSQMLLGMRHHDERVAMPIIEDIREQVHADSEAKTPAEKSKYFLELYRQWFTVFDSLMRLIDKLDNGQSRLPQVNIDGDVINGDSHIASNAFFAMPELEDHIQYEGEKTFVYTLHLSLTPGVNQRIATYRRDTGEKRIAVPKQTRDNFVNRNISYFETMTEQFGKLYFERILLIALDSFNSNPDLHEVKIQFMDPARQYTLTATNQIVIVDPLELTFHRDNIVQEIEDVMALGEKDEKKKLTMRGLETKLKLYGQLFKQNNE